MRTLEILDLPALACPRCHATIPGDATRCETCGAAGERDGVLDAWVRAALRAEGASA